MKLPKEMVERSLWALWFFVFGGAGLWLIIGTVGYWNRLGWVPDNVSDWVQALGSIGALVVAIWISTRQRREQINDAHRREKVVSRAVIEIAVRAVDALAQLEKACGPSNRLFDLSRRNPVEEAIDLVDMSLLTMNGIEMVSLPNEYMIPPLFLIKGALVKGMVCGEGLKNAGILAIRTPFEPNYLKDLRQAVASAKSACLDLTKASGC
ncbi:hypothetical protein [Pseudomonas sp.]|uniref:hypothetical protein n=1 Tax=Pseudomonas sp. TaxID=306 RepID=UPI002733656B|nr:hypothetical protein [Pseudomonas sp.]MDP3814231.1 hypothetical protein [Pseudomonas sp.]